MVRTSILHQTHLLIPNEDHHHHHHPELNFRLKEQECVSLVKKCQKLEHLKQVHGHFLKLGLFWSSSYCTGNLIATCSLSDWGSMDYARSLFDEMPEPGSFAFNHMIRGYIKDVNYEEAILMYTEMLERVVEPDNFTYPPLLKACARLSAATEGRQIHGQVFKLGVEDDEFVKNSLINMYGKCGEIRHSCAVFDQMEQQHISVASWSALISAHANLGMWCQCLSLFRDMSTQGCCRAEESTLVTVLSACTHLGALNFGKSTHGFLLRNICGLNTIVETSLIDMYVKCGSINKGLWLFQRMKRKNQLTYSVIISGLAMNGFSREALSVFSEMLEEGLEPDDVVYVSVLTACSNSGLVEEGFRCFERMVKPTIQHYGCMVDLLGRAGMIREAHELITSMPVEPNDVIWRNLLSACKVHREIEIAEIAAKKLFEINPKNAGDYVTLSNTYARAQKWPEVARVRTEMANKGVTQTPGFSQVEVKRKVYKFVSQDSSRPQCKGVYEMIHQMEWQLKFEGYSPDTSKVLFDVSEEEKRQRLSSHSQKLAIAFALIHTSGGSPVKIVRNIRMCDDCHTYTKLISTIYDREITVRERNNQFHHFKDGTCSCRDYW